MWNINGREGKSLDIKILQTRILLCHKFWIIENFETKKRLVIKLKLYLERIIIIKSKGSEITGIL